MLLTVLFTHVQAMKYSPPSSLGTVTFHAFPSDASDTPAAPAGSPASQMDTRDEGDTSQPVFLETVAAKLARTHESQTLTVHFGSPSPAKKDAPATSPASPMDTRDDSAKAKDDEDNAGPTIALETTATKFGRAREKQTPTVYSGPPSPARKADALGPVILARNALSKMQEDADAKAEANDIVQGIISGKLSIEYTRIKLLGLYHIFVLSCIYHAIINESDIDTVIEFIFGRKSIFEAKSPTENIDDRDIRGRTALHYGCAFLHAGLVQHLLNNGADFELLDKKNRSVFHYACGVYIIPERLFKKDTPDDKDFIDDKRCVSEYYHKDLIEIPRSFNEKKRLEVLKVLKEAYEKKYGPIEGIRKLCAALRSRDTKKKSPFQYARDSEYGGILAEYEKITAPKDSGCCCVQ